ncbi:hypothetical protein NPIL_274661 [Nephila pilipes]|uniref:Uncharacterized protein n=1 Tax=Nephila pilipes TaxID=299642 RepID=A0A8X6NMS9_NEPPI|nr:hypothetical protein NPIL_274661 [Nephila pilipes]
MIVQSESLPSREEGRKDGCCCGVSVPSRELRKVLLGAYGTAAMVTNCVVKGGREIADACYDGLNFEFFMKKYPFNEEMRVCKELYSAQFEEERDWILQKYPNRRLIFCKE